MNDELKERVLEVLRHFSEQYPTQMGIGEDIRELIQDIEEAQ